MSELKAQFWSLQGQVSYAQVRDLQLSLVDLRSKDLISDTILFLEHQPVITRGRGLQWTGVERPRHMPLAFLPSEIEFAESERGGDLTYHGPGQLVIYPICKLDGQGFAPFHSVEGFLRNLEKVLISYLASLGIHAGIRENATGVWIESQKIASIGIAVRKWVSYHGVALNCVNDLKPFHLISPCGFNPEVMTRLSNYVSLESDWREWVEAALAEQFQTGSKVESISLQQAFTKIDDLNRLTSAEALYGS